MTLHISIHTPSPELDKSPIDEAVTLLAARAAIEGRAGRLPEGPSLDITFMLTYKEDVPLFSGMRMGGYTRENQTLFFEAAVPEHIVRSAEASQYVALVMQDVVENAQEYFQEFEVDFDAEHWRHALIPLVGAKMNSTNIQ